MPMGVGLPNRWTASPFARGPGWRYLDVRFAVSVSEDPERESTDAQLLELLRSELDAERPMAAAEGRAVAVLEVGVGRVRREGDVLLGRLGRHFEGREWINNSSKEARTGTTAAEGEDESW